MAYRSTDTYRNGGTYPGASVSPSRVNAYKAPGATVFRSLGSASKVDRAEPTTSKVSRA